MDRSKGAGLLGGLAGGRASTLLTGFLLGVLAAAACSLYSAGGVGDDVYIYMTYAKRLIQQGQFAFNIGERSNGATSLAHLLLLTGASYVFGLTATVWKTCSSILFGAAIGCSYGVFSRLCGRPLAVAASLVLLCDPLMLRWSGSGMENSLVALGLVVCLWLHCAVKDLRRGWIVGVALGLLSAIRPDLLIFGGAYVALKAWRDRLAASRFVMGFCATVLVLTLATYLLTGYPTPQTAAAKAVFLGQSVRAWPSTLVQLPLILIGGSGLSILALACLCVKGRSDDWMLATIIHVAGVCLYLVWTRTLISTRYDSTLAFPLLLAAVYGLLRTAPSSPDRFRMAFAATQAIAAAITLWYLWPGARAAQDGDIRRFAAATDKLTPRGARIALTQIGVFGFHADRYVIDLVGLTDPQTLRWGEAHGKPLSMDQLEQLLRFRRAGYYVCITCKVGREFRGVHLRFVPVYWQKVMQQNSSRARIKDRATWVLYRLDPSGR